ncbi:MAG: fibronectin type III domain-containing protein [bacterium]|nr:fibronectin type III domain-containing protein [bacterium]
MNKNHAFWIVGAIIIIVIGFVLFRQSPVPSGTSTTDVTNTSTTNGTANTATGGARPTASATAFASVSSTTAVVVGNIVPGGKQTTYWFEYGPTASYGFFVNMATVDASWKTVGVAAYITGLKPGTSYYFRLGAKNSYGVVYDGPYNFITSAK